jgi:plastocyanin
MRRLLIIAAALTLAAPAAAQGPGQQRQPEWRQSTDYDVLLRPFGYEPKELRLEAGRPVRLRFVNSGQAPLSFSAPAFFRAATVRSDADAESVRDGTIRLAPGERRTIVLVPAPGRYRMRSANFVQRLLGMGGRIIVE